MAAKLPVAYVDPFDTPGLRVAAACLPQWMQRRAVWGRQAPRARPLDVWEVLGQNPYEVEALEPDLVWRVQYFCGGGDPAEYEPLGMRADAATRERLLAAARLGPPGDAAQAEADWARWEECCRVDPIEGRKGEYCRLARKFLTMFVVRLPATHTLLLYCPVVVHDGTPLAVWLQALGPVRYIVIGSCTHTTHLPEVLLRYPDALVVGPPSAEGKLRVVRALPRGRLDFNYYRDDELHAVNGLLRPQGVELHRVDGDAFSQAACLLAHRTLLEVDLLAGHHDACPCRVCAGPDFRADPLYAVLRVFFRVFFRRPNAPLGHLPAYRFAAMDPASPLSALNWPSPETDGSGCRRMAAALRALLALPFQRVGNVHQLGVMTAEDFRRSIDAAWRWLDGCSLLPPLG